MVNVRRQDLNFKRDFKKIQHLSLCENHFTAEQFMNPKDKGINKPRKQLRKDAVPTLFDVPNPPKQLQYRRKLIQPSATDECVTFNKAAGNHSTYTGKIS